MNAGFYLGWQLADSIRLAAAYSPAVFKEYTSESTETDANGIEVTSKESEIGGQAESLTLATAIMVLGTGVTFSRYRLYRR